MQNPNSFHLGRQPLGAHVGIGRILHRPVRALSRCRKSRHGLHRHRTYFDYRRRTTCWSRFARSCRTTKTDHYDGHGYTVHGPASAIPSAGLSSLGRNDGIDRMHHRLLSLLWPVGSTLDQHDGRCGGSRRAWPLFFQPLPHHHVCHDHRSAPRWNHRQRMERCRTHGHRFRLPVWHCRTGPHHQHHLHEAPLRCPAGKRVVRKFLLVLGLPARPAEIQLHEIHLRHRPDERNHQHCRTLFCGLHAAGSRMVLSAVHPQYAHVPDFAGAVCALVGRYRRSTRQPGHTGSHQLSAPDPSGTVDFFHQLCLSAVRAAGFRCHLVRLQPCGHQLYLRLCSADPSSPRLQLLQLDQRMLLRARRNADRSNHRGIRTVGNQPRAGSHYPALLAAGGLCGLRSGPCDRRRHHAAAVQ